MVVGPFLFFVCVQFLLGTGYVLAQVTSSDVFINEFHYDDYLTDSGEFVEIAIVDSSVTSPDLLGLALYDGATGEVYYTGSPADATLFDETGSSLAFLVWDISGIQDGGPDGIALYQSDGSVIEFLSYEGSFMATDGVAEGIISTDIGYSQDGSAKDASSLQRVGTGPSDIVNGKRWVRATKTRGAVNPFQTFGECVSTVSSRSILVNELHYDDYLTDSNEFVEFAYLADSGISANTIGGLVLYESSTGKSTLASSVTEAKFTFDDDNPNIGFVRWDFAALGDGPHGFALVDQCNTILHFLSYEGSFLATEGFAEGVVSTDIGAQEDGPRLGSTYGGNSLQRIGIGFAETRDDNRWVFGLATPGSANILQSFGTCDPITSKDSIVLNEIHYDDYLTDSGEFVEFAFLRDRGVSLSSIGGIVLYEGTSGKSTFSYSVSQGRLSIDPGDSNVGFLVWNIALADGRPDGIALVDGCNKVVHFHSYEGSFLATEGVAANLVSSDIRYQESGNRGEEFSLQRIGIGFENTRINNEWIIAKRTPGESNALQVLGQCSPIPSVGSVQLNEIHYDDYLSDSGEFVEFAFLLDSGVSPSNIGGLVFYGGDTSVSSVVLGTQEAVLYFDPEDPNIGFAVWETPLSDGPFAMALVDGCNNVVQFVSVEGTVTATEGVAKGMVSTDIGYSEDGNARGDESLQRESCQEGDQYPTWVSTSRTPGARNGFQDVRSCLVQGASPVEVRPTPAPIALPVFVPTFAPVKQPTASPVALGLMQSPVATPQTTSAPSKAPVASVVQATEPIQVTAGTSVTIPVPPGVEAPEVVAVPAHGTIVIENDGVVIFQPDDGFRGTDSFDLKYCGEEGSCSIVNYTVNITFPTSSKSSGAIAGIVIPVLVVIGAMGAAAYIYWRKRQLQATEKSVKPDTTDSPSSPVVPAVTPSNPTNPAQAISDSSFLTPSTQTSGGSSVTVVPSVSVLDTTTAIAEEQDGSATPPMAAVLPAHDTKPHPEYKDQFHTNHPLVAVALPTDENPPADIDPAVDHPSSA